MRGVVFRCRGSIKSLDKEYFYVIANGVTKLNWQDVHNPANIKVIKKVKRRGADSISFKYALDAIPSQRNRRTLLMCCREVLMFGGDVEFLGNQGNCSGIGCLKGVQWQNNHPLMYYLSEIKHYFTVVTVDSNRITAIKD